MESTASLYQSLSRLQRVVEVSLVLNSTLELQPLLELIVETAQEITQTEAASILLLDAGTGDLRFRAASGQSGDLKPVTVPVEGSIAGYILQTGMPLMVADVSQDPRFCEQVDRVTSFCTRSILGVPLLARGRIIGVLEAVNKIGMPFDEQDAYILTTVAAQAATALENARLIAELQKANEELSQLDQNKNDFIAVASHELRTPLAVILGYMTFLQSDATGELSTQLDVVVNSALRLRALIDEMLLLRQLQSGAAPLDLADCDLAELIRNTAGEFEPFAAAKQQRLALLGAELAVPARLDQEKIRLALGNIVANAIKYTPEGGLITLEVLDQGGQVGVTVRDSGIGMETSELDRIFDLFYQVGPVARRRYEGLGLGLSIAKDLVDIHHGSLHVASEPGAGSAFTIRLPRNGLTAFPSASAL